MSSACPVFAVFRVKDEEDVIGATVGNMLAQVDHVIVADNLSTDDTRGVLHGLGVESGRLTVVDDPMVAYYQSSAMSKLARMAVDMGARWVVPADADEMWGSRWGTVAEVLEAADPDYGLVTAELIDHMATGVDPCAGDVVDRMPWRRREPLPLPKVAARAHRDMLVEQGNHWVRLPIPARFPSTPQLTVHHYPYRSVEQVIRKVRNGAAAYAATDGLDPSIGAHWRGWADWSDDQIRDLFYAWYWREDPTAPYTVPGQDPPLTLDPLIYDPVPRFPQ